METAVPFVTFETGTWDDPWVESLKPLTKLLWVYLFTSPEAYEGHGVFEPRYSLWKLRTGLNEDQIRTALNTFTDAGRLQRFGRCYWIVNYLRHRRLKGNNLDGALSDIKAKWHDNPELLACIIHRYGRGSNGVLTGSAIRSDQIRTDQNISEQNKGESQEHIDLALEAASTIQSMAEKYQHPMGAVKFNATKDAKHIRLLVKDGVPLDAIIPALTWAWEEFQPTEFCWCKQLIGIAQWRKKTSGSPQGKFVNMYGQWRNRHKQERKRGGSTPPSTDYKDGMV